MSDDMDAERDRLQRYLDQLASLTGGAQARAWQADVDGDPATRVHGLGYRDLPEPGVLTAFTYGLSSRRQPAWTTSRPELTLTVRSDDPAWVVGLARLAADIGDRWPFHHASTITIGRRLADDTRMDGYVVFAPSWLPPEQRQLDLGDDLPVRLVGVYPCYESERQFIGTAGFPAFWEREFDAWSIDRDPVA